MSSSQQDAYFEWNEWLISTVNLTVLTFAIVTPNTKLKISSELLKDGDRD